jgi:hypothetical protein
MMLTLCAIVGGDASAAGVDGHNPAVAGRASSGKGGDNGVSNFGMAVGREGDQRGASPAQSGSSV